MAKHVEGGLPTEAQRINARLAGKAAERFGEKSPWVNQQELQKTLQILVGGGFGLFAVGALGHAGIHIVEEITKNPEIITNFFPKVVGIK